MAEAPIDIITSTDYVGTYTAYVYADGHTETDPPNRPQNREDVQRARRKELAKQIGTRVMEVERTRDGISGVNTPGSVRRESTLGVTGRSFNEAYHNTLEAFAEVAETMLAPPGALDSLIQNADVGGALVTEEAYEDPEGTTTTGVREETFEMRGR